MKSPSPPDPYEQADAQAGANIDSAIANDLLNNRTEITPTGRIDYIDQGTQIITDSQGKQRVIPIRSREVTLSDDQQAILDLTEDTSKSLMGTASDRADFLQGYLQDGIDTSNLTPWTGAADVPDLDTGQLNFGSMETFGGPNQDVLYGYQGSDTDLGRIGQPGGLLNFVPLNTDFSDVSVGGGGRTGSVSGGIAGAGEGIRGSVDLNTYGGQTGGLQRQFSGDRVSGAIDDSGQIQTSANYQGPGIRYDTSMEQFTGDIGDAGDIRRSVGVDDVSVDRRRVEDALMSRHNRQFEDIEAGLDQKLRAQGLVPGSEAYDTQFRQMREMQNDAIMQSILAGGQEQSRQFGLDLASGQFANQAQQQAFGQEQARGLFGLDVNAQNNQTALLGDQFRNQAVGQGFRQALDEGAFANAAQGQQFGQNVAATQMDMAAAAQNNALNEARGRFANDAQNLNYQQTLANAGFGNQAQLDMGNFANAAQQQGFGQNAEVTRQNIAAGSVNNQAADISNRHAVAAAQLDLQAQQAGNSAMMDMANFYNNAIGTGLGLDLAATGFNNQATQQEIANAAGAAGFQNTAVGQDFAQGLGLLGFNNQAAQTDNQNALTQQNALNEFLRQQYALDEASAGQNNALRQAQLQEQFALRGQPLNEIASLMSGSQLMMPQFTAPFQTGTPPVPIADLIQKQYEAQLANSAATAQGLMGLGGSIFGALPFMSDRRTKKNVTRIGKLRNGTNVYSYRFRHDDKPDVGVMADEVRHIPGAVEDIGGIAHVHYDRVLNHAG